MEWIGKIKLQYPMNLNSWLEIKVKIKLVRCRKVIDLSINVLHYIKIEVKVLII